MVSETRPSVARHRPRWIWPMVLMTALAGCGDRQGPQGGATAKPTPEAHLDGAPRVRGIDISNYQGEVDWARVKATGIGFAYLQASQGRAFLDPNFEGNVAGIGADIPFGAYHFFRPEDDAEEQARLYLKATEGRRGVLPPMLDVEVTAGLAPEEIAGRAKRWLEVVGRAVGCTPLVYSYGAFWETNLKGALADYPLWLADYAERPRLPAGTQRWTLWQYSQTGRVDGVKGPVDLDYFNGDDEALAGLRCDKEQGS